MGEKRKARCLCGAVQFSARLKDDALQACHCEQCQRWTGGGPLVTVRVEEVEMTGEDKIQNYLASAHGERAFCSVCGTTLYWKMQGRRVAFLPVGLFEDQSGLTMREEIFVDRRPGWLPEWPGAEQHNEAEMQAQLKSFLEGET